ncbi:MAG: NAD(P)H-hydrate dehydratase [Deferrisomatales bacterium]
MIPLVTGAEMRALDRFTIEEAGLPGAVLMETAGRGVFERVWARYRRPAVRGPVVVVCGRGNNGGDGFVAARCLAHRGCAVTVYLLGALEAVRGDAAVHLGAYLGCGGRLEEVAAGSAQGAREALRRAALVIDAVLGTGLTDEVRGAAAEAIGWMQEAAGPVVSVDIPSGVSSDTGRVCGAAVRADLTVTFAFPKRGHFVHPGAELTGRLEVVDIGVPPAALAAVPPTAYLLEDRDAAQAFRRPAAAHKGTFGHVVVFGGSPGKTGAAGLAAWGALRCGAGLATVAWPEGLSHPGLPLEVMTAPLPGGRWDPAQWEAARPAAARAQALVVGPGMGAAEGAQGFLGRLLGEPGPPAILDADALNLVARSPGLWKRRRREVVLTPHPGEAARLLGCPVPQVQGDRLAAVAQLAERFECPVVLKGAGTLIRAPGGPVWVVSRGNPGMATAGSGDVLSGVVGALAARGLAPAVAARVGAHVHALAGDLAAGRIGEEGMVASDLLAALPRATRRLAARALRGTRSQELP